ncbi:hypothetical protein FFLO_02473 [Filobasidium floriforme]|uniref:Ribokinase n=1 Tax=Filobasidium floriforme TaxID=5210 RepID=A0A8K0JMK4_9TREE|nr:hypothetical protein FFLO_02473 [Filobasidium floriforme]
MTSSRPSVLVRGSINIDEFYSVQDIVRPGQTIASRSLKKLLGGKGANQAKAVACAGADVLLDGAVGGDDEGKSVKGKLCDYIEGSEGKIIGDRIVLAEGVSTGKAVIQLADDGENCIIILGGANTHPRPDPTPLIPDNITHLLLANEIPLDSTLSYLKAAHSRSATTIFNPSPMLSAEALRAFPFDQLEWLIVNQGEMSTIYDSLVGKTDSISDSEDSPEKVIENALALYKKLDCKTSILCTLGGQGVIYVRSISTTSSGTDTENVESGHLPAAKLLNPIKDTTGAGDCFMGTFAAGMARLAKNNSERKAEVSKEDFTDVLKTCLVACSMCVEKEGAQDSYHPISAVEERKKQTFA